MQKKYPQFALKYKYNMNNIDLMLFNYLIKSNFCYINMLHKNI